MKKIYLFCSAGMSSSIIVGKMQKIADEKGILVEVKYFPESQIDEIAKDADVIVLSPQIKYAEAKIRAKYNDKPIYLINMMDYGTLRADTILENCLSMCKDK